MISKFINILVNDDVKLLHTFIENANDFVFKQETEGIKFPFLLKDSPLLSFVAIYFNAYQCYDYLKDIEKEKEQKDQQNRTILHFLATSQQIDLNLLNSIINSSTENDFINSKDNYGNTPLHYASYYGRKENCEALIKKGASFDIENNQNEKPIEIAAKLGFSDVVLLLGELMKFNTRPNKWKDKVLENSIKSKSLKTCEIIINKFGMKIRRPHVEFAVCEGSADILNLLLSKCKTDISKESIDKCIQRGDSQMYKILLETSKTQLDYSQIIQNGNISPNILSVAIEFDQNKSLDEDNLTMKGIERQMKQSKAKGTIISILLKSFGNSSLIRKLFSLNPDITNGFELLSNLIQYETFNEYENIIDEFNLMQYDNEQNPIILKCLNNDKAYDFFKNKGAIINIDIIIKFSILEKSLACELPQITIIKDIINYYKKDQEHLELFEKESKDKFISLATKTQNQNIINLFT